MKRIQPHGLRVNSQKPALVSSLTINKNKITFFHSQKKTFTTLIIYFNSIHCLHKCLIFKDISNNSQKLTLLLVHFSKIVLLTFEKKCPEQNQNGNFQDLEEKR